MPPILSVVTGTMERLDYLRAAIQSVRVQIPDVMPYEIIVVDAGSKDGTATWCEQQNDVVLIQQGEPLGAIRAFNAGCERARGDYVLLLNDDVLVVDGAILKALVYLNSHPNCGAVAFMDDRKAPGYESGGFHVQTISAIRDGRRVDVTYAQVGLYRRWLGDMCRWWDIGDEHQHTYGGDSHLSAQIWMRGYTVDAVEGAAIQDRVAPDELRQRNYSIEQQIGSAYYRQYPDGVLIGSLPKPPNPQPETLRILYLPLFSPGYGRYKRGLFDALSKVGWCYELDYIAKPSQFMRAIRLFQPHIVLTQFHGANVITPDTLDAARRLAPEALFINWNGDIYLDQLTAPDMLALLQRFDLQLTVNTEAFPIYDANGIHCAYWQIAAEPVSETLPNMPSHAILFQGNAYSVARKLLAATLREIDPLAGIYGMGWDEIGGNGQTFYQFDNGAALYRNCKIAISDNQYGDKGFVSNRLFEAMANGAFLLQQRVPGLTELLGIEDGVHLVEWADLDDLREKIAYYLAHDDERQQIAMAGERFIREAHSFDSRVRQLFEQLIPRIDDERTDDSLDALADRVVAGEGSQGWSDGIPR